MNLRLNRQALLHREMGGLLRPAVSGHRRRSGGLHQRHSGAFPGHRSPLRSLHPEFREKFTFIQIGAPSRTHIKRYQDLMTEVEGEVERINHKWRTSSWKPIIFVARHHSHKEIAGYYREANLCLVTSLHDGMNLVAKEYRRGSIRMSKAC